MKLINLTEEVNFPEKMPFSKRCFGLDVWHNLYENKNFEIPLQSCFLIDQQKLAAISE